MLAIKTYGQFWSKDLVDWGWRGRGNQGSLSGALRLNAEAADADFRNQKGIYILFDKNREIVYVGQSGRGNDRLLVRLRSHTRGPMRDRWTNFSWFGFLSVGRDGRLEENNDLDAQVRGTYADALNEVEAVLLQVIEPRLNKQGPRWNGAIEYFQFSAHEPATIEDLWRALDEVKQRLDGATGIEEAQ